MTSKANEQKDFRSVNIDNDLSIQAYAPVGAHGGSRLIIFSSSQIDYLVAGEKEEASGICLHSGVVIPVQLSLRELHRALHRPDFKNDNLVCLSEETKKPVAANDDLKLSTDVLQPGDKMTDGSIFAGVSPDTGKQMFVMPQDGLVGSFNQAAKYAKTLNSGKVLGHNDWRVPTKAELDVLWKSKDKGALSGTFNVTGSDTAGWYWSSTVYSVFIAWQQRFSDGGQTYVTRSSAASVRCVR